MISASNQDARYLKFSAMTEGATLEASSSAPASTTSARTLNSSTIRACVRAGRPKASGRSLAYAVGSTAEGAVGALEAMGELERFMF